jgi:hypothetical protein
LGWLWVAVTGMAIAPGGILIVTDHMGRAAGDGFVQFTSPDLVDRALEKHKEKIGHRWEELSGTPLWATDRLAGIVVLKATIGH